MACITDENPDGGLKESIVMILKLIVLVSVLSTFNLKAQEPVPPQVPPPVHNPAGSETGNGGESGRAEAKPKEIKPAKLISIVLSTVPVEKTIKIPVTVGGRTFNLELPSYVYHLSKEIKVDREFNNIETLVKALEAYCKEIPEKHEWTLKMISKDTTKTESSDHGFSIGREEQHTLRGLLTPTDNKSVTPMHVTRIIYSYQDTAFRDFVIKDEKGNIDWGFVEELKTALTCEQIKKRIEAQKKKK